MNATLPLLVNSDFPPIRRKRLECLQLNVGYLCNQSCTHCHVSAGPKRTELMGREIAELAIEFLDVSGVETLDITGGAPELNPNFRYLVREARARGRNVVDRSNLTILEQPGQEDLAEFLAAHSVQVIASLPCYIEENVDRQRGRGVYDASIRGIRRLNSLGYGAPGSDRILDLVFNPQMTELPPEQASLEIEYKRELEARHGIRFNRLLTMANMPIGRFGSVLVTKGQFGSYMSRLREAHQNANLDSVMCRSIVNVDWKGFVYDCDFNQMIGLPMRHDSTHRVHLSDLLEIRFEGRPILVLDHCYGCTAGQGSSCDGALR